MMMKEEKHTPQAVSFEINFAGAKHHFEDPQVKKRLEAGSNAEPITLDKIEEKLHKAEERRASFKHSNSPPFEERREKVLERRASLEKACVDHLQKKVEEELALAEQKRIAGLKEISHKLKEHNSRVYEIRN